MQLNRGHVIVKNMQKSINQTRCDYSEYVKGRKGNRGRVGALAFSYLLDGNSINENKGK